MKTDLFQSCGHCWVFQMCWHIECSTFTASSFRIWSSSNGSVSSTMNTLVPSLGCAWGPYCSGQWHRQWGPPGQRSIHLPWREEAPPSLETQAQQGLCMGQLWPCIPVPGTSCSTWPLRMALEWKGTTVLCRHRRLGRSWVLKAPELNWPVHSELSQMCALCQLVKLTGGAIIKYHSTPGGQQGFPGFFSNLGKWDTKYLPGVPETGMSGPAQEEPNHTHTWSQLCPIINLKISFFNVGHFESLYWICYCITSGFFSVLVFWPWGMWGLSSPIRDQTHTSYMRRWSLNHWQPRKSLVIHFCRKKVPRPKNHPRDSIVKPKFHN